MRSNWERGKAGSKFLQWFRCPERPKDYLSNSLVADTISRAMRMCGPMVALLWAMLERTTQAVQRHPVRVMLLAALAFVIGRFAVPTGTRQTALLLVALALAFFTTIVALLNRVSPKTRSLLLNLTLLALIMKMVLIMTVFQFWIHNPDEYTYYHYEAARLLSGEGTTIGAYLNYDSMRVLNGEQPAPNIYIRILAKWYFITGPVIEVGKLCNVFFLIITALLLYAIGKLIFDERVGHIAFGLTLFTPQLTIWTTPLLRESMIIMLLAISMFFLVRFSKRPETLTLPALLATIAASVGVYLLRSYIGIFLLATCFLVLCVVLLRRYRKSTLAICGILIALVAIGGMFALFEKKVTDPNRKIPAASTFRFSTLQAARDELVSQGHAYEPHAKVGTLRQAITFLPHAYLLVLFAPLPPQVTSAQAFGYYMFSTVEYLLLFLALIGAYLAVRHAPQVAYPLLLFALLVLTFYGIVDSNVGSVVRHRMQAWAFLMIFAAKGFTHIARKNRSMHRGPFPRERTG